MFGILSGSWFDELVSALRYETVCVSSALHSTMGTESRHKDKFPDQIDNTATENTDSNIELILSS